MSPSHRRTQRTWLTAAGIAAGICGLLGTVAVLPAASGAEAVQVCRATLDGETTDTVGSAEADSALDTAGAYAGPCAEYGPAVKVGNGRMRTYAQFSKGRPTALGFVFDRTALTGLPEPHTTDRKDCYDVNGDGRIDPATECIHHQSYPFELPGTYTKKSGPFTWALVNWNAEGHDPQGVYTAPHFDFHFYIQSRKDRDAIRVGPCAGPGLTDCDDFATARKPVPAKYTAPDYADFGAVVAKMGNHLIDGTGPEFHGRPFTKAFLYGNYDGGITFYEPMITYQWLIDLKPGDKVCTPVKTPAAFQQAGDYPTSYCAEYRRNGKEMTVSLNDFVTRRAG
ncbi:hypothetical protein ACFWXO_33965 [Kitasatospora sp. NPDC059088]|uniref:hypothetical protein n=1 Tax=Kitasatospora sp. NPDC059088 TaxID=3346722 RepID=UPI0036D1577B